MNIYTVPSTPVFGARRTLLGTALLGATLALTGCPGPPPNYSPPTQTGQVTRQTLETGGSYLSGPRDQLLPKGGISIDLGMADGSRLVSDASGDFKRFWISPHSNGNGNWSATYQPIENNTVFLGRLLVNQQDKVILDTQTGVQYHHSGKIVDKDGKVLSSVREPGL